MFLEVAGGPAKCFIRTQLIPEYGTGRSQMVALEEGVLLVPPSVVYAAQ